MVKFNPYAQFNVNPLFATCCYSPTFTKKSKEGSFMGDSDEFFFQYLTDRDALQAALPEPMFKVGEKPIVTLGFTWLNNSEELAGGEYGISVLFASAHFDGEKDHLDGNFALMMPETNNYAVCHGRDFSGDAKFLVWMPRPYTVGNENTRCETRVWNYEKNSAEWKTVYGVDFAPMTECDKAAKEKFEKNINSTLQFTWKVIPSVAGGCEVAHAFSYLFNRKIKQLWAGKSGELYFGNIPKDSSLVMEHYVIEAMKKLPVREVIGTYRAIGEVWGRFDSVRTFKVGKLK